MAVPTNIEELAHDVRNAIYGSQVREAIASSMEATADVADWSRQVAQDIIDGNFDEAALSTEIENKLNQLEQDYAPTLTALETEITDARGSFTDLSARLLDMANNINQNTGNIGDLNLLSTQEKSNLVGAINENVSHLAQIMKNEVYLENFPRLTNETDDSPRIQRAINSIDSGVVIISNDVYKCDSGITFNADKIMIEGIGSPTLDFTNLSSGYAIVLNSNTHQHETSTLTALKGLRLQGSLQSETITDGIYLHVAEVSGNHLDQLTFENVLVDGFRYQMVFGDNIWCFKGYNLVLGHAQKEIIRYEGNYNTGENISFYGCTLYSSSNAENNATAVHILEDAGYIDLRFFGCSFDYNDLDFNLERGRTHLIGCYIENENLSPFAKVRRLESQSVKVEFFIDNTSFHPTEPTTRTHAIEVEGNLARLTMNNFSIEGWEKEFEIIKVTLEQPIIDCGKIWYDFKKGVTELNGVGAHISTYLNTFINGDGTSLNGWEDGSSPNGDIVVDGLTNSIKCTVSGTDDTHSAKARQSFIVSPGNKIYFNATYQTDNVIADDESWKGCVVNVEYFAYNGYRIKIDTLFKAINSSSWKTFQYYNVVPKGCYRVLITVGLDNALGSAYFKDVVLNIG